jgi:hypothetical protein
MKANSKFKKELQGGIATWVLMMFGLSVIMYMFGLQSIWSTYSDSQVGNATQLKNNNAVNITNPDIIEGGGILAWLSDPLHIVVAGTGVLGVLTLLAGVFTKSGSVCAYIFIIGMATIILNIFIFPVSQISSTSQPIDAAGIPFTAMLLGFFNAFYILTIFEVVSGRPT